jgi:quercetin dioxygenase-like cupin family protein
MQKISLTAMGRERLDEASKASSQRSAATVFGGHERALRQTVLALCAGAALDEHENPGEATVYVLSGRVQLVAGEDRWDGSTGDLLLIPDSLHSLVALQDSVVLLSAVPRAHIR